MLLPRLDHLLLCPNLDRPLHQPARPAIVMYIAELNLIWLFTRLQIFLLCTLLLLASLRDTAVFSHCLKTNQC